MTELPSRGKFYWILLALEAAVFSWLNWHAQAMTGLLPYYDDFARTISAGFDPAASVRGLSTFPMWGYGWVVLLFRSKLAIVILQQALAMSAVWSILKIIRSQNLISVRSQSVLELLLLASPGWFALHSVLWPNSFAASLIPLSLLLIVVGVKAEGRLSAVASSGVLFGILLNFRSEHLLLPIAAALAIVLFEGFRRRTLRLVTVWVLLIYTMLIPWAVYAHTVSGHFLLTSTNSGHVFFIGLGTLPGNKWGVQPHDGDSVMRRLLETKFGTPAPSSLTYSSDVFLKKEFLHRIQQDPGEYARKMMHSLRAVGSKGAYAGEFYESAECSPGCAEEARVNAAALVRHPGEALSGPMSETMRTVLFLGSEGISRALVALSYLLIPFSIWIAIKRRNLLAALAVLAILYQTMLNMTGDFLQAYSSNVYLFYLVNIVIGASGLLHIIRRSRHSISRLSPH